MREIKFRAWGKKERLYLPILEINAFNWYVRTYDNKYPAQEIELEQFTGLYDNNGNEIYEGDIVKIVGLFGFEFTGQVVYDRFCFNLKKFCCSGFDYPNLAFSEQHDWQVIGNIHENPEMMEKIR